MRDKFLTLILLGAFCSCKKDSQTFTLNGKYIETSPVRGRSQLEFIGFNIAIKSEPGSPFKDVIYYQIIGETIKLTPSWTTQGASSTVDFKIIDKSTFQIGNLYGSIPESPPTLMTYKK